MEDIDYLGHQRSQHYTLHPGSQHGGSAGTLAVDTDCLGGKPTDSSAANFGLVIRRLGSLNRQVAGLCRSLLTDINQIRSKCSQLTDRVAVVRIDTETTKTSCEAQPRRCNGWNGEIQHNHQDNYRSFCQIGVWKDVRSLDLSAAYSSADPSPRLYLLNKYRSDRRDCIEYYTSSSVHRRRHRPLPTIRLPVMSTLGSSRHNATGQNTICNSIRRETNETDHKAAIYRRQSNRSLGSLRKNDLCRKMIDTLVLASDNHQRSVKAKPDCSLSFSKQVQYSGSDSPSDSGIIANQSEYHLDAYNADNNNNGEYNHNSEYNNNSEFPTPQRPETVVRRYRHRQCPIATSSSEYDDDGTFSADYKRCATETSWNMTAESRDLCYGCNSLISNGLYQENDQYSTLRSDLLLNNNNNSNNSSTAYQSLSNSVVERSNGSEADGVCLVGDGKRTQQSTSVTSTTHDDYKLMFLGQDDFSKYLPHPVFNTPAMTDSLVGNCSSISNGSQLRPLGSHSRSDKASNEVRHVQGSGRINLVGSSHSHLREYGDGDNYDPASTNNHGHRCNNNHVLHNSNASSKSFRIDELPHPSADLFSCDDYITVDLSALDTEPPPQPPAIPAQWSSNVCGGNGTASQAKPTGLLRGRVVHYAAIHHHHNHNHHHQSSDVLQEIKRGGFKLRHVRPAPAKNESRNDQKKKKKKNNNNVGTSRTTATPPSFQSAICQALINRRQQIHPADNSEDDDEDDEDDEDDDDDRRSGGTHLY